MSNTWTRIPSPLTPERMAFIKQFKNTYNYIRILRSMVLDIAEFRGDDRDLFSETIAFIKDKVDELFRVEDDNLTQGQFDEIKKQILAAFQDDIETNHCVVIDPTPNQREALDRFKKALVVES